MAARLTFRLLGSGFVILAVMGASGCAFGTRQADLAYPPKEKDGGVVATAQAATTASPQGRRVVLAVTDERPNKARIGNVRNAFGMDTANVVTNDDVAAWVAGALRHDLAAGGYSVDTSGAGAGEGTVQLEARVIEVYCDVYMTYDGDVTLDVTFTAPGRPPLEKYYEGAGSVGVNWAATAESYAESLARALQDAISQVMKDLTAYEGD